MSTAPDTTIPEIRDELIRKTVEFAAHLQERFERAALDPLIAASQARAVWHVTSGLVDDETSALLAEQGRQIGVRPIKRFYVGNDRLLLLAYQPDGAGWVLVHISTKDGSRTVLKRSTADVGMREPEISALVDGLLSKGFVAL